MSTDMGNDSLTAFAQHLKKHQLRLTGERLRLVKLVLGLRGHFAIEELVAKARRSKLSVSRATIYRMMPLLVEAGLIKQSLLSEGLAHYEVSWQKEHHDHLICSTCSKVIEFQDSSIEILQREIADKYGFSLDDHVMELVGRCRNCRSPKSASL